MRDLLGRHRTVTHEPQTLGLSDVHPIEAQDVEVKVQIQGRPEPLDHRDETGPTIEVAP